MSMADTAEYQLSALGDTMTEALTEAEKTAKWQNPAYREGFTDAMTAIAREMGLKARTTYHY